MEHTPPLPSGFNINGYLIQFLKQTAPLCHDKLERLIVYFPEAAEECLRFERLVLLLQGVA